MEKRIGFGPRFWAYLIDCIIITGLSYIIASLTGDWFERFVDFSKITEEQLNAVSSNQMIYTFSILLPAAVIFVSFVYNLLEGFTGYTLGKLLLGLQVGNQDGTPAEISTTMLRFALKNISSIIGLFGAVTLIKAINNAGSILGLVIIVGCFIVLGDKKQSIHDMLAKTAVFKKNELSDGSASQSSPFMN